MRGCLPFQRSLHPVFSLLTAWTAAERLSILGKLSLWFFSCHLKRRPGLSIWGVPVAQILAYTIQITVLFKIPCTVSGVNIHLIFCKSCYIQVFPFIQIHDGDSVTESEKKYLLTF